MLEAMSLQKVHPWRAKSFKFQVGALNLLHVGGVQQDQGGDRGVDLPNVNLGGRVRWNSWTFSWNDQDLLKGRLPNKVGCVERQVKTFMYSRTPI